jgi:quinohemoprotein ethanol dehydrogenase
VIYPDTLGAHNWQAMSFNPNTGLVYIPYLRLGMKYGPTPPIAEATDVTADPSQIMLRIGVPMQHYRDPKDPLDERGSLLAWDPATQKVRWRVDYPYYLNAGTMTTAGNLVFQGTNTGHFYAYAADTGRRRWSFDAKLGIIAPPISYSVNGSQYVSLLVGYGGMGGAGGAGGAQGRNQGWQYGLQPRRLLTFMLDGTAKLPPTAPPDFTVKTLDHPQIQLDAARVERGEFLFGVKTCTICHGVDAVASGNAPDLRGSQIAFNRTAFKALLRNGSMISRGMPPFDDLTDDEIENIYQYIRSQARQKDVIRHRQHRQAGM